MSFLNKRHILIVTALAVLSAQTAWAQFDRINPVPQQIARPSKGGTAMMRLPDTWRVQTDAARSSSFAVKALRDGMPKATHEDRDAAFVITLGVKGDRCTKKLAAKVPKRAEAYWLSADERGVTIVGADEQGLFYGVQSLLQSVAETSQLERGTVTDWPDVRFRGTVEGFYGTPWSHEARLRQIDFYGRNKLNTYIYGPKDDLYHRHRWRMPYPEEEAQRISELASYAREHGVNFCWAIHPGVDIRWNNADRDTLVAKLESVYKLGVRSFAVFFDDISGDGTDPVRQAALLNHVNRVFIHKHSDVTPLMMCPTIYNRSWSTDNDKYLRTLGSQLDKDVDIMWTGNAVVADIDRESMEWINSRIGRKAYLWWNFPVSDYVRDRILLGPAYGNGTDIAPLLAGFVSNPMEHAEASKISLHGIADYTWNMRAYNPDRNWEQAVARLLPSNAHALRTFALYNKDLGPNGHGFRREEGTELQAVADKALGGDKQAVDSLMAACADLRVACDLLLADKSDPLLVKELRPWLLQGKNMADYGVAVCEMALAVKDKDCTTAIEEKYRHARALQTIMADLAANATVRHAHQPGIKIGTKVLLPTIDKLFSQAVETYNTTQHKNLNMPTQQMPFTMESDVPQLSMLPLSADDDIMKVAPSNEIVNWQDGGSITITADQNVIFTHFAFDLGSSNATVEDPGASLTSAMHLELFTNGKWRPIALKPSADGSTMICADPSIGNLKASKLRLTNVSGKALAVGFKRFEAKVL